MIKGRLEKELKEVCLLEQTFVKDSDFTIKKLVAEVAKTVGSDIKVGRVVRFEVGEGIEKKEENFAEEVAKQLKYSTTKREHLRLLFFVSNKTLNFITKIYV